MMSQIWQLKRRDPELCRLILSTATLAYRPLHLLELASLAGLPERFSLNLELMAKMVGLCGSFLTIREEFVYFVHQSAKDYLSTDAELDIFPHRCAERHGIIVSRSLQGMSNTLRRDIYGLRDPGCLIEQARSVEPDPLAPIR
jgi:hypothetical protein